MSRDKATSQEEDGSSSISRWTQKLKLFVVFLKYVPLPTTLQAFIGLLGMKLPRMEAEEFSGGVCSSFTAKPASAQGSLSRYEAVTTALLSQPWQPMEPYQLRHETCFFFYPPESELVGDRFQAQLKLQVCINQSGKCASTSHLSR